MSSLRYQGDDRAVCRIGYFGCVGGAA